MNTARLALMPIIAVMAIGVVLHTRADSPSGREAQSMRGDEYIIVDLSDGDWEERVTALLVDAKHPDIPAAIEAIRNAGNRSALRSRDVYAARGAGNLVTTANSAAFNSVDEYVNCGYGQRAWVLQDLSGYSQGYGFWAGLWYPGLVGWTNPTIYIDCPFAACLGVATFQGVLRAPRSWSIAYDGWVSAPPISPYKWCES